MTGQRKTCPLNLPIGCGQETPTMPCNLVRSLALPFRTSVDVLLTKVPTVLSTLCLAVAQSSYGAGVDRAEFLQLFKRLANEQSFTADEIGKLTGWELKSRDYETDYDRIYTNWLGHVGDLPFEVRASSSARGGYLTLRAVLPVRPYCVDRAAMLDSYGYNFHRSMLNIEGYPDESSISAEVKSNIKFFGWEPYYKFKHEAFVSSVNFEFLFSDCASAIYLLRENNK